MDQESQGSEAEHMPYQTITETLIRTKVYFGGKAKFDLSVKQKNRSRYLVIKEMTKSSRHKRIIVPTDKCLNFLIILKDIRRFVEYPRLFTSTERHNISFLYMIKSMQTEGGREYYFDAMISDYIFDLRISYKYGNRFELIHIDLGCVASFVDIIGTFDRHYPSQTGNDDLDPNLESEFDIEGGYLTRGSFSSPSAFRRREES